MLFSRELIYFITLIFVCQVIFRSFFRFFEVFWTSFFIWKVWTLTSFLMSYSFEQARSLYHIDFCLSSDFQKFFQIFLKFFSNFVFHLRGLSLNFFSDELLFQASFHRISHLTFICQAIFKSFFRFFEVLSNLIFIWKVWTLTSFLISRSFERAFIRYHIWHSFVNWFSEVFSEIFRSFCRNFLRLPMRTKWPQTPLFTELSEDVFPATAQLRYHL